MFVFIPREVAESLGVGLDDKVVYLGVEYTVVGVLDSTAAGELKDLDGTIPTPIRPEHHPALAMQPSGPPPSVPFGVGWSEAFIVPYKLARRIGKSTCSQQ